MIEKLTGKASLTNEKNEVLIIKKAQEKKKSRI
ncbi:MAG: hypothetical protein GBAus27B_000360 [Mycoplasmataceae bacterium]|nr:MAG: hypothetical protein GBAus27B_000360 [Mycoplasmataceae bacterium]